MTKPQEHDNKVTRPFADFLREHTAGASHEELSDALHELTEQVMATGRKGSITYTLTLAPVPRLAGAVQATDRIKLALPEPSREGSLFFQDKHGNLTGSDPNQLAFETIQPVPTPDEYEQVDPHTGEITTKLA